MGWLSTVGWWGDLALSVGGVWLSIASIKKIPITFFHLFIIINSKYFDLIHLGTYCIFWSVGVSGAVVKQLQMNQSSLAAPSVYSKKLASASTMMEVKSDYVVAEAPEPSVVRLSRGAPSLPTPRKMKMKKK